MKWRGLWLYCFCGIIVSAQAVLAAEEPGTKSVPDPEVERTIALALDADKAVAFPAMKRLRELGPAAERALNNRLLTDKVAANRRNYAELIARCCVTHVGYRVSLDLYPDGSGRILLESDRTLLADCYSKIQRIMDKPPVVFPEDEMRRNPYSKVDIAKHLPTGMKYEQGATLDRGGRIIASGEMVFSNFDDFAAFASSFDRVGYHMLAGISLTDRNGLHVLHFRKNPENDPAIADKYLLSYHDVRWEFVLNFKGEIKNHNAEKVDGSKLVWHFNCAQMLNGEADISMSFDPRASVSSGGADSNPGARATPEAPAPKTNAIDGAPLAVVASKLIHVAVGRRFEPGQENPNGPETIATLDGSGSLPRDPDLQYQWTQTSGLTLTLPPQKLLQPIIKMRYYEAGKYTFRLVVSRNGVSSAPADVVVLVGDTLVGDTNGVADTGKTDEPADGSEIVRKEYELRARPVKGDPTKGSVASAPPGAPRDVVTPPEPPVVRRETDPLPVSAAGIALAEIRREEAEYYKRVGSVTRREDPVPPVAEKKDVPPAPPIPIVPPAPDLADKHGPVVASARKIELDEIRNEEALFNKNRPSQPASVPVEPAVKKENPAKDDGPDTHIEIPSKNSTPVDPKIEAAKQQELRAEEAAKREIARLEAMRAETEKQELAKKEAAAKAESARQETLRAEAAKKEAEAKAASAAKAEADRIAAEREAARVAAAKAAADKSAADKAAAAKAEAEKIAAERAAADKAAAKVADKPATPDAASAAANELKAFQEKINQAAAAKEAVKVQPPEAPATAEGAKAGTEAGKAPASVPVAAGGNTLQEGIRLIKAGQYKAAIDVLQAASQANPKDEQVLMQLAIAHFESAEMPDGYDRAGNQAALEKFNAVLALDDQNAFAYMYAGHCIARMDRPQDSMPFYQKGYRLGAEKVGWESKWSLGNRKLKTQNFDGAVQVLTGAEKSATEAGITDARLLRDLALAYHGLKQDDDAVKCVNALWALGYLPDFKLVGDLNVAKPGAVKVPISAYTPSVAVAEHPKARIVKSEVPDSSLESSKGVAVAPGTAKDTEKVVNPAEKLPGAPADGSKPAVGVVKTDKAPDIGVKPEANSKPPATSDTAKKPTTVADLDKTNADDIKVPARPKPVQKSPASKPVVRAHRTLPPVPEKFDDAIAAGKVAMARGLKLNELIAEKTKKELEALKKEGEASKAESEAFRSEAEAYKNEADALRKEAEDCWDEAESMFRGAWELKPGDAAVTAQFEELVKQVGAIALVTAPLLFSKQNGLVVLNAEPSLFFPKDKPMHFAWEQIISDEGPSLNLRREELDKKKIGLKIKKPGTYKFELVVSNGDRGGNPVTVTVEVR